MDLNELRTKIDGIDAELVRLFTERMELAGQVADYKRANAQPIPRISTRKTGLF